MTRIIVFSVIYQKPLRIVLEFMDKGSLLDFVRSSDGKTTPLITVYGMLYGLAEGMEYIQSEHMVHR